MLKRSSGGRGSLGCLGLAYPKVRRARNRKRDLGSNRVAAAFAGADADAVVERQDEDFAVADLASVAGAGSVHDGLDGRFDECFVDGNFELQLREEPNLNLGAAVNFRVAALSPAAAYV